MDTNKIIITIDGPSASGKGTIAKQIAKRLDFDYLDSGLLYRKIAAEVIKHHLRPQQNNEIAEMIKELDFNLKNLADNYLRTEEVAKMASLIAPLPEVRQALKEIQQQLPEQSLNGLVADGRDMGTIVFPQARYKFFLTAQLEERAKRRFNQLQLINNNVIFAEVLKELNDRDTRDASRALAPLVPAPDAVVIDSTNLTIEQVVELIIAKIN